MEWKQQLRELELREQWDEAIEFMQSIVKDKPHERDPYIYMNFLIMNLLTETQYRDKKKRDYYKCILKKSFDESYAQFSEDAEYLFCTGITAVMFEWYFGIEPKDYTAMLAKAAALEPDNLVYQRSKYLHTDRSIPENQAKAEWYARLILQNDSILVQDILSRGAFGEYFLSCTQTAAYRVLGLYPYGPRDNKLSWKDQLKEFVLYERWFTAIRYIDDRVCKDPFDIECYIVLQFLMINFLLTEQRDQVAISYCTRRVKAYFDRLHEELSNNPEYLFWAGTTFLRAPRYVDLTEQDCKKMIEKALQVEPDNQVYQTAYYLELAPQNKPGLYASATACPLLQDGSHLSTELLSRGIIGEYRLAALRRKE